MKRKHYLVVLVLGAVLVTVFLLAPPRVDKKRNGFFPQAPEVANAPTPALHKSLFISDLHADTLMWERPILELGHWGHVDLPRLQKGHIALQAFSIVTETPIAPNVKKTNRGDSGLRFWRWRKGGRPKPGIV